MKIFRLIGMALMAILIGVNFIACSDDDEGDTPIKNDDGIVTNQKKLMQMKMVGDSETITWEFSYDSKGRLASVIHTEKYGNNTDRNITHYTWSNNTIIAEDGRSTRTYTLNDGLVRTIRDTRNNDWSNASFTYNSSKQLIATKDVIQGDTYIDTYTWENGRIIGITDGEDYATYITYSGKTCKGYFPFYNPSDNDYIFYVHPELIGLRNSQLPDQVSDKDNEEESEKCTYTLDKDGYVESCTFISIGKGQLDPTPNNRTTYTNTTTLTFKWE